MEETPNKRIRSRAGKARSRAILSALADGDPARFRTRTVQPDKGHGRKDRPRNRRVEAE